MRVFELPEEEYMALRDAPAYDAIIPARVRYDERLSMGARLLYGEIRALCRKEGFCWASNEYFAQAFKIDARSIRRWIHSLSRAGHIKLELDNNNQRKIWLGGVDKNVLGVGQKCPPMQITMEKEEEKKENITKERTETLLFQSIETIKNGASIPADLDNARFREAWAEYTEYRKGFKGIKFSSIAQKRLLNTLNERPTQAVQALSQAILRNWRGFDWAWLDNDRNTIRKAQTDYTSNI